MTDIERIKERIDLLVPFKEELARMQSAPQVFLSGSLSVGDHIAEDVKVDFVSRVNKWYKVTSFILMEVCGDSDPNLFDFSTHWRAPLRGLYFRNEMIQKLNRAEDDLEVILEIERIKTTSSTKEIVSVSKPPKVFISHKKEDQQFANALINLINFIIGPDGEKIFCSSIPGYGIRQSKDIMEELRDQFVNYQIFMVIIHSPRYYKSTICLNEMGASWALGTEFASFMTKDCNYDLLQGVIGRERICISINDEIETLNAHLNDFKNDLIRFFNAGPLEENKWENERSRFVKVVTALSYTSETLKDDALFDTIYVPAVDTIFSLLDMDHFSDWAYRGAIAGDTIMKKSVYDAIDKVIAYIKSRPKNRQYSDLDSLIHNLGLLLSDFKSVFSCHAVDFGENAYIVDRFYKKSPDGSPFNPYYEEYLQAYEEHVRLISDLIFELARLCNLILSKIRESRPGYKQELGILFVDNRINDPDLVYREDEISDRPYPGIEDFIALRLTRDKHYGSSATINMDGFERTAQV